MTDSILTIPILLDHLREDPVGTLTARSDGLFFEFKDAVSRDALFDTFGNAGFRLLDMELRQRRGDFLTIKAGQILEFSLSPPRPTIPQPMAGS